MLKMLTRWQSRRKLKPLQRLLAEVNALESSVQPLSDEELFGKTAHFKADLAGGVPLDTLLPSAFAVVREVAVRVLKRRPYDTQVMGAVGLYTGAIIEMGTGEGKTLTAPFAAYAHFLQGNPVHISTANEYLAQRDASMMQRVYAQLGMSVGALRADQSPQLKQQVYQCDVVYGTHIEFAMDYLRDNLVRNPSHRVQRGRGLVIVDEADAALIDDARTPVVVSAFVQADEHLYNTVATIAKDMRRTTDDSGDGHFYVDHLVRSALLTDAGYEYAAQRLAGAGLIPSGEPDAAYDPQYQHLLHRLTSALTAHHMLHKEQHYVVQDGQLVLVDALTGRLLPGRRWDSGLQQAMEAKEGLPISPEGHNLGSISLQYYFRMYPCLSGMTGTATSDAEELLSVYGTPVIEIPPNRPSQRIDEPDRLYRTAAEKFEAVIADIQQAHAKGQPVLVGTGSIAQSEQLAERLTALGLPNEVLNARQHAREAEIIAQAGRPGAITVSTNMAGRGVDIMLGGNANLDVYRLQTEMGEEAWNALSFEERAALVDAAQAEQAARAEQVRAVGGLRVIGLERYETRRMDRQLRGRAGRQGDPGSTCFYLCFEDPLIENFAGEQIRAMLTMLDVKPGDELEAKMLMRVVDSAQRQMEGRSAGMRKQLVQYDNVLSSQRKAIYELRDSLLDAADLHEFLGKLRKEFGARLIEMYVNEQAMPEEWDFRGLRKALEPFKVTLPQTDESLRDLESETIAELVQDALEARHEHAFAQADDEQSTRAELYVALGTIDRYWIAHLDELDQLRKGIGLRSYAKDDPRRAYQKDAFEMFSTMLDTIRYEIVLAVLTWFPTD